MPSKKKNWEWNVMFNKTNNKENMKKSQAKSDKYDYREKRVIEENILEHHQELQKIKSEIKQAELVQEIFNEKHQNKSPFWKFITNSFFKYENNKMKNNINYLKEKAKKYDKFFSVIKRNPSVFFGNKENFKLPVADINNSKKFPPATTINKDKPIII